MRYIIGTCFALLCITLNGQNTNIAFPKAHHDTSALRLNSDAMFHRPFMANQKWPFAIGGYVDVNSYYGGNEDNTSGFSFLMPDLALFFVSNLNKRMKFLSEVAFESAQNKVKLRTAVVDLNLNKLINVRTGLILNPIGAFNQNHDGPNYEFVDRPMISTVVLPAVFSNVGVGLFGKTGSLNWTAGYELYLTNGFNDKIIDNELDRTALQAGVSGFNNFSGKPMFTGKLSLRNRTAGEIGISYMSGIYTEWGAEEAGLQVAALNYSGSFLHNRLNIKGEIAQLSVDVPSTYLQTFGTKQMGAYVDVVGTVLKTTLWHWDQASVNIGVRLEYTDYNDGNFVETGGKIFHHSRAIVPCISFRPNAKSVIRLNYRYQEDTDFLGNEPTKTGAIQLGFSSYF